MKKVLCYQLDNGSFPIKLEQTGVDSFTVTYGMQVEKQLNYGKAAMRLGCAIMHKLSCDGIVDNREKGQK